MIRLMEEGLTGVPSGTPGTSVVGWLGGELERSGGGDDDEASQCVFRDLKWGRG